MKNLFAATLAVFFMFAVNGCSDDSNSGADAQENVDTLADAGSSSSDVEVSSDVSENVDLDASEVSDTAAGDVSDSDVAANDGGNAATD